MEYLHLFENFLEHDDAYMGLNYHEPWVAYVKDENIVTYNKQGIPMPIDDMPNHDEIEQPWTPMT